MSDRRRIFSLVASVSLVVALLAQGFGVHLHDPSGPADAVHAEQHDAHPVGETHEAECVACRTASSSRLAVAARGVSLHEDGETDAAGLPDEAPLLLSRLVRAAAPPRAPPA